MHWRLDSLYNYGYTCTHCLFLFSCEMELFSLLGIGVNMHLKKVGPYWVLLIRF